MGSSLGDSGDQSAHSHLPIIPSSSPLIVMWPCPPLQQLPLWRLLPSHSRRALNFTSFCRSSLMPHCFSFFFSVFISVLISTNYPLCMNLFILYFSFYFQTTVISYLTFGSHRCCHIISKKCKVENELLMSYEELNIFWHTCCCIEFIFIIVPLLEPIREDDDVSSVAIVRELQISRLNQWQMI